MNYRDKDLRSRVLWDRATEPPFSGEHTLRKENGVYHCAGCGAALFSSDEKYDSHTPGLVGWPAFMNPIEDAAIRTSVDWDMHIPRIAIDCAYCGAHLGHYFDDEASPNGKHYCVNSAALDFHNAAESPTTVDPGPASSNDRLGGEND